MSPKKTRAWTHTDYFVHARAPPTRVEKFLDLEVISAAGFLERRRARECELQGVNQAVFTVFFSK